MRKKNRSGSPPQVSIVQARLAVYSPLLMMGQGLACASRVVSMPKAFQFSTTAAAARFMVGLDSLMLINGTLNGDPSGSAHTPSTFWAAPGWMKNSTRLNSLVPTARRARWVT